MRRGAIQEVRAVPIHFRCPHCEKLLAIGTAKGGTQIHCPMCARLITVPPRTEVKLPTTTVIPPDFTKAWWMDAPPVAPSKPETPPEQPSPPPDVWWLTAKAPSTPLETATPTTPAPSVPPSLPEPIVSAPAAEPPPDRLVFEPPAKTPPLDNNSTNARFRFFTPLYAWLLVMVVAVLLVATALFFLLRS
jgi:phage FluMu protein Com